MLSFSLELQALLLSHFSFFLRGLKSLSWFVISQHPSLLILLIFLCILTLLILFFVLPFFQHLRRLTNLDDLVCAYFDYLFLTNPILMMDEKLNFMDGKALKKHFRVLTLILVISWAKKFSEQLILSTEPDFCYMNHLILHYLTFSLYTN